MVILRRTMRYFRAHYRVTRLTVARGVVFLDGSSRLGGKLGPVSFELLVRANRTATLRLLDGRAKTTIRLPRAGAFVYTPGDPGAPTSIHTAVASSCIGTWSMLVPGLNLRSAWSNGPYPCGYAPFGVPGSPIALTIASATPDSTGGIDLGGSIAGPFGYLPGPGPYSLSQGRGSVADVWGDWTTIHQYWGTSANGFSTFFFDLAIRDWNQPATSNIGVWNATEATPYEECLNYGGSISAGP